MYLLLLFVGAAFCFPTFKQFDTSDLATAHLHRRTDPKTVALANLVLGLVNGTIPGAALPPVVLPGLPSPILIELPPVVAAGRKPIPDAAHPFIAPGPTDQRGGCPGMNIMANYGYLSRDGITNPTELLYASQEMLGLAPDSTLALIALVFASAIDPTTLKVSIGTSDARTNGPNSSLFGQAPGLFSKASRSQFEVDGSIAYGDSAFYADGNTNHFNSTYWSEAVAVANSTSGGIWNATFVNNIRYQRYRECIATNPICNWSPKEQGFNAGDNLVWLCMPSSGVNGSPGPAYYDIISTFFGVAQYPNGTYYQVPGRLPGDPVWYRRATPVTVPELGADGADVLLAHPQIFGSNQGAPNTFVPIPGQLQAGLRGPKALCVVFNQFQADIPSYLTPARAAILEITDALLAPARMSLGC